MAYLFIVRPPFQSLYWALSTGLLNDGSLAIDGKKITDFELLYPLFLAVTRILSRDHVLIVQIVQAVIAGLGSIYLYKLVLRQTGRSRVAFIAASLYAIDPLLIKQATAPGDLALVTALLIAFAYYFVSALTPGQAARAGLLLGLVVLTRSMTFLLVPLAVMILIAERRGGSAVALMISATALVLPVSIRNYSVSGSYWPTRSGLNLYIGNSPYTSALLPDYDLDLLEDEAAAVTEPEMSSSVADAALTRYALEYMAEHPLTTLGQKMVNIVYFFSPRLVPFYIAGPETRLVNRSGLMIVEHPRRRPMIEVVSYSLFFAPVLIAALVGTWLRRHELRRDALLWCIVANFVAIHAFYYPATRYRAPMEFVVLFYAAVVLEPALARAVVSLRSRATIEVGDETDRIDA